MKASLHQILHAPLLAAILMALALQSCNLEKEISIDLPVYQRQPVVECYLEPGKPFRLLLTRSFAYFDPFSTDQNALLREILLDSARVSINHNGRDYTLANQLVFDFITRKFANYTSNEIVPNDFSGEFTLNILTKDNKTITATTRILPVVPIDSIVVQFKDQDTLARVLTYFNDDITTKNYYRRMLNIGTLDSIPRQAFSTDDRLFDTKTVAFGTGYSFSVGDTVFNTLYHIDKAYFDYLESVNLAVSSNGNPIAQPSVIKSNITGTANATGIFTGLSYDRKMTIIKR